MHLIDCQHFKDYSNHLKSTDIHDLKSIYTRVFKTLKSVAKDCFVWGENHRFYPKPPKMFDLAIVSLTIVAECVQITSENLLWAKIRKDYPGMFTHLIQPATVSRQTNVDR